MNDMKTSRVAAALIPLLLMSACVLPPKDEPRVTTVDAQALGLGSDRLQTVSGDWWKAFGDPQLDRLVDDALANNPGLAEALARVRSAQAQAQAAGAATRPGVTLDGQEVRQRFSENYYIPPPYGGGEYWVGQLGANLNWDLDFWGRQADLIDKARLQTQAAALDHASARLALSGSLAQAYLDLYRAYALADIATQAEQQRETLLKLTEDRVRAGLDTQLDVKSAEALLPQARAARLQAESARDLAVHRLAALSGHGADAYDRIGRPQLTLDVALPLPAQLPIDLLAHRPDVLAARARVDAATAGRAAAKAAFYPDISLTAFAGYQAIGLDTLFKGGSGIWGFGPSVHLPLFDAQRLKAGYHGATAEVDAAVASYNDTVLNAVRDVADQLTLSRSEAQQLQQSRQTLSASEAAYALAQKRYAAGLSSQIVVLNAESNVLSARRDVVSLQAALAVARVTLLLTVGGTFDPPTPGTAAGAGASS
ncbi:efflux transporter outer membrane subunit [Solimonas terrae]|uniref:Efflux transporter outer membrane subunit n=1 Tax=Solimonas terrae TaxID=1396819 RepID=A0A6M2BQ83_9GAMM|nr:efflux transporter outer membrane subunit [Solimonas terrae]NGY04766.1 efflux transporter outer membrane subunit [Solimonas terrae]